MDGTPYKTCENGKWTGQMRCLKPCTVNRDDMNKHNIQFRFVRDDKLYSVHTDVIEFSCTRGRPVGSLRMRQKCIDVCSVLPNVPHSHVSEGTSKAVYQEGDVIHFSCESGYISDQISTFVCTTDGWLVLRQGKCYSCLTLPDVPNAQVTQETRKSQYRAGDMIHFACEPGYTSALTIKYVCATEGWQPLHKGSCYLSSSTCDPPPTLQGLTVKGLPENSIPIRPDHILTFSCDGPGKYLNGVSVLICGQDGQWNNPFPTCIDLVKSVLCILIST
ncbi:complement factor H-related protein 4-like [Pelmatolapia mariae]|uniref:complement factor H-related protein 4-like n=1 Tax=Pelmatolapia mariae TaxID=158779 RepID=UPI002FE55FA0